MATIEETKKRIDDLAKRTSAFNKRKAEHSGLIQAKKDELANLIREIKAAGLDPKNLSSELEAARASLESECEAYDKDLTAAEAALAAFDKK